MPTLGRVDLIDGIFVAPAGLDASLGPFAVFPVDAARPTGTWSLICGFADPATGETIVETAAPLAIH